MRILHLIHSEGVYGAERILVYLAREQQRAGHEPVIGSIRDPGTPETPFEHYARACGLKVRPIRVAPRPTPGVIRRLLQITRGVGADILHSHGYKPNILLGPLPRRVRGPMLTTLHGWTNAPRFSRLWLYERLDQLSLGRMDAVVVVAPHMLELPALRGVSAQRRHLIENGIPPREERLAELAARGAAPIAQELREFVARKPTFVAIGRLSQEKGFDLLIEAFAQLQRASASAHQLLIVGEGSERPVLEGRVAAAGLTATVRLPGFVDGPDRLLEGAAGFVMSSLTEGMPLVLLEALQWRVPVIATRVGAIPALLSSCREAVLVAPGDAAALQGGLQAVCSPPWQSGACGAPEQPPDVNDANRMARAYQGVYERIT